jgi:heat shock 70kDa protein 1/2/6/8
MDFEKVDIKENARAMRRLRTDCEKLKIVLSTNTEAFIEIDNLIGNINFMSKITRNSFEEQCDHIFTYTFESVINLLKDNQLDKSQIDQVFLSGGSTYMPKILDWHKQYFGKEKMNFTIGAEEIVVRGAAVQAAMLTYIHCSYIQQMSVNDVLSMPIYAFENHKPAVKIFNHNIRLPCFKKK